MSHNSTHQFRIRTTNHVCSVECPRQELRWYEHDAEGAVDHAAVAYGMYELNEETRIKSGAIVLCNSNGKTLHTMRTESGILDMKWCGPVLGCALSNSKLQLYSVNGGPVDSSSSNGAKTADCVCTSASPSQFSFLSEVSNPDEGLFLSLDWYSHSHLRQHTIAPKHHDNASTLVAVSTELSSIMIFDVEGTSQLVEEPIQHVYHAHTLCGEDVPAWITIFNPYSGDMCGYSTMSDSDADSSDLTEPLMTYKPTELLSGGDDCLVKLWDLRTDCSYPAVRTRSTELTHTAGVTSAQWHPNNADVFATGSYDGSVCVWDRRSMVTPMHRIDTGGGVWRAKWLDTHSAATNTPTSTMEASTYASQLLVGCMHAGTGLYNIHFHVPPDTAPITDTCVCWHQHVLLEDGKKASDAGLEDREPADQEPAPESEVLEPSDNTTSTLCGELAYGVDIISPCNMHASTQTTTSTHHIASCSFYDNIVDFWSCKSNND